MEAKKDTSTMDYGEIFKGNTRAFEQLFKNYYAPLRGYCQGIVIDKQISEDIVQDAFVYLWNNRKTLEIKTTIQTYLYSTVRHGALPEKTIDGTHSFSPSCRIHHLSTRIGIFRRRGREIRKSEKDPARTSRTM